MARAARPPPPSRRRRDLTRTRVPIVLRATAARPILNRGAVAVLPVFPPSQFSCHHQSHPSEARGSRRPGLPRLELAHTRRALREGGCEEALAAPRSPRAAAPSPVVGRPVHSPAYRGDTVPAVNRNLTSGTMKVHRNLDFVFDLSLSTSSASRVSPSRRELFVLLGHHSYRFPNNGPPTPAARTTPCVTSQCRGHRATPPAPRLTGLKPRRGPGLRSYLRRGVTRGCRIRVLSAAGLTSRLLLAVCWGPREL